MTAPRNGNSGNVPAANSSLRPRAVRPTPMRVAANREAREPREVSTSMTPRRVASSPRMGTPAPREPRAWVRPLKAAVLVAVAVGSAVGVIAIKDAVERTDHLPLRAVVVAAPAGAEALSTDRESEVLAYAELTPGTPFFGVDTDVVARRVQEHPFVREAKVSRDGTDSIAIEVSLRAPMAMLRIDGGLYLVDEDGDVMKRVRAGDPLDLPLITLAPDVVTSDVSGTDAVWATEETMQPQRSLAGLADAIDILDVATRLGLAARISEVVGVPAVGFELVLDDGARVRLGAADIDSKLRRLQSAEQMLKQKGQAFSFMWLDDGARPERVAVRLRPATETSPVGG